MPKKNYDVVIERGHSDINDRIIDFLKTKIEGHFLDIGANTGWLLEEVPNGIGIDASPEMVKKSGGKVMLGVAENLPFQDNEFDTVVMSCVLEQCKDWKKALKEAQRVGKKVIGINPYPNSPWGELRGWVRSVIPPFGKHERFDQDRYYFEI
ncbi:MAG: class I SAM-dependent methyltransferase [Patescibacteria group bacterium]|nr:class I SAM-dependent methyltransferase [Patescibacteria group bacterium]